MKLVVEEQELAICRLPAASPVPEWLPGAGFRAVIWTREETSVLCDQAVVPDGVTSERDWRALRVAGPLEFSLAGVLASMTQPLADASVPIFAVSTFDTDYVLVKQGTLDRAIDSLRAAGHEIAGCA